MNRNSKNYKRTARHIIATVIIVTVTIFAPAVAIAELYSTNISLAIELFFGMSSISLEVDHLCRVMHLVAVTFLTVMAIVVEVLRIKHPQLHREGYAMAIVIISIAILTHVAAMVGFWSPPLIDHHLYEKIEIWSAYVTKTDHAYTVAISFINTGDARTSIEYILLNGVSYDDRAWEGTSTPVVSGDLTPKTIIEKGVPYSGMITFSNDCSYVPIGKKFMAGVVVTITIHTTGYRFYGFHDYNASITLP